MYREFDIGTAKPSLAERAQAPHHLFDFVDPTQDVTAGEYARQARQTLSEINSRQHLPIVVGGTGLYLRALLEGLFAGPARSEELRERLRERAANRGSGYLHKILARLDPATAEKIHANDAPKLIRAIEVCLASRQKMSDLWQQGRDPLRGFRILRLGLDPERSGLYERINSRAAQMFDHGLVDETKTLLDKYGDRARPLTLSRLQTSHPIPRRRTHPRASYPIRPARPPQLRQAPNDVVPPRAGCDMAQRFRRQSGNPANGRRAHASLISAWIPAD